MAAAESGCTTAAGVGRVTGTVAVKEVVRAGTARALIHGITATASKPSSAVSDRAAGFLKQRVIPTASKARMNACSARLAR